MALTVFEIERRHHIFNACATIALRMTFNIDTELFEISFGISFQSFLLNRSFVNRDPKKNSKIFNLDVGKVGK